VTLQTLVQAIKSVLAAFAGIQSNDQRKKDFEQGSWGTYIVVGLVLTIVLVFVLILLVSAIL